ncbi:MAG: DNA helicase RecQ [Sulfurospirillum sp.]|nr:MAG: DNA helicase RecQ [Sulfurospirillum sp.]
MQKSEVLEKVFGFNSFRSFQEEAVDAILEGRDLLMILPTGGGKSLCYQLPSLLMEGVTVVVSPLIALMQDQVRGLNENGIRAATINSDMNDEERQEVFTGLREGSIKLLYVAPERMSASGFIGFLQSLKINFFVIDEAHCVSEWGHEFRADYRKLHLLKENFPQVPVAAFTATATPKVEADIHAALRLHEPLKLRAKVFRKNLTIRAQKRVSNGRTQLLNFLQQHRDESGIIYTFTRKETEQLAAFLQSRHISARAYHARLSPEEKSEVMRDFMYDKIDIVVATIAFGMGIDKSNIRFVVHTSLPKTIENYYQEIGRAGRDGLESETLLLYTKGDEIQKRELMDSVESDAYKQVLYDKLQTMYRFALSSSCKHKLLALYFGDEGEACGDKCDSCLKAPVEQVEITKEAQMFLSAIYRTGERFGQNHIIDILRGSQAQNIMKFGHDKLSVYGIGELRNKNEWGMIADRLFELSAIQLGEHRALKLQKEAIAVLKGHEKVWIDEDKLGNITRLKTAAEEIEKDETFEAFRSLRMKIATQHDVPAYIVFSDKTLHELSRRLPKNKEEMLEVNGIGEVKYERYGEAFLELSRELQAS